MHAPTAAATAMPRGPWRATALAAGLLGPDGVPAPTIFAEMSALAARHEALNLGQGIPADDTPNEVLEAACHAIRAGRNQYAPGRGVPALLDAIARHESHWYGIELDPETEIVVTAGATEALAATLLALLEPGDEVVTIEPWYDAYAALCGRAGARLVGVPLRRRGQGFVLDPEELAAAVTDRTRIILVNTPHNPTGVVLPVQTLDAIVALAIRHDAIIVADEVYEHLVFDGTHEPIASRPGARDRTLTISSAGKTFSTTGWKIGWITGPAPLITAVLAVKQFLTYTNGTPFQSAVAVGLELPEAVFAARAADLAARRDVLLPALVHAGLDAVVPASGYFVCADAAPIGVVDAADFCRALPERAGLAAIPVSAFCRAGSAAAVEFKSWVRVAYCQASDVVEAAVPRLAALGGTSLGQA